MAQIEASFLPVRTGFGEEKVDGIAVSCANFSIGAQYGRRLVPLSAFV